MIFCPKKFCESRKKTKQHAIVKAATNVFLEQGFEKASMDHIASEAGVSKQTIYSHFGSKENLFSNIVSLRCQESRNSMQLSVEKNTPVKEALIHLATGFVEMIFDPESVALYRLMATESCSSPDMATSFLKNGPEQSIDFLSNYLKEQTKKGNLKVENPTHAAENFFSMLKGFPHIYQTLGIDPKTKGFNKQDHVKQVVDTFLRAYKA